MAMQQGASTLKILQLAELISGIHCSFCGPGKTQYLQSLTGDHSVDSHKQQIASGFLMARVAARIFVPSLQAYSRQT